MKFFNREQGKHWEFTELIVEVSAAENQDKQDIVWIDCINH